ncbi:bacteriocin immunity protein [Pseudomonas frederiksbergensis]|uniref:bacteriocin immunity protein n=1 Tax=Pseudomonas frederiksbergensis TaxID=104087 RepID=UPI0009584565|nr:bacteriocin immunity protein [Pseudomonas frederiksbergensis]APV39145.1 bacteriocin immunity protein [Pseudomonas frederiksbergensis]
MTIKSSVSDYTEEEFIGMLQRILGNDESEEEENKLVHHFNTICGHPAGSDLIFYPEDDADDSAESITRKIKEWRAAQGLPGFKEK